MFCNGGFREVGGMRTFIEALLALSIVGFEEAAQLDNHREANDQRIDTPADIERPHDKITGRLILDCFVAESSQYNDYVSNNASD